MKLFKIGLISFCISYIVSSLLNIPEILLISLLIIFFVIIILSVKNIHEIIKENNYEQRKI